MPLIYPASEALGNYDIRHLVFYSIFTLAGAAIGVFGGQTFLHNRKQEFLWDKKEEHRGFEYLQLFCAPPGEDGEIIPAGRLCRKSGNFRLRL